MLIVSFMVLMTCYYLCQPSNLCNTLQITILFFFQMPCRLFWCLYQLYILVAGCQTEMHFSLIDTTRLKSELHCESASPFIEPVQFHKWAVCSSSMMKMKGVNALCVKCTWVDGGSDRLSWSEEWELSQLKHLHDTLRLFTRSVFLPCRFFPLFAEKKWWEEKIKCRTRKKMASLHLCHRTSWLGFNLEKERDLHWRLID